MHLHVKEETGVLTQDKTVGRTKKDKTMCFNVNLLSSFHWIYIYDWLCQPVEGGGTNCSVLGAAGPVKLVLS